MGSYSGQVVVVTGAGRGIGRAIAEAFAAEGAAVALLARSGGQLRDAAEAIRRSGGAALAVPTDVTDADAVRAAFDAARVELGTPDLLVNNAGSFSAIGPVWEVDPERWWRDVTTNLRGVFLCFREALRGMVELARGRVINVIGGGTGSPFPHGSGYASSKAAVMRLTECAAAELREAGSRVAVFAMGPGLVRTDLTEYQVRSAEGQRWMPRIQALFREGKDVPPTRAAALALALGSGRFDRLAGRCFGVGEDLEETLGQEADILRKDRKTLRFR